MTELLVRGLDGEESALAPDREPILDPAEPLVFVDTAERSREGSTSTENLP